MVVEELSNADTQKKVAAYVCVNLGTRSSAMTSENAAEALGSKEPNLTNLPPPILRAYDSLDVPTLFIRGQQDLMTPLVDIQAITERNTRKVKAELVEPKGKHAFPGN